MEETARKEGFAQALALVERGDVAAESARADQEATLPLERARTEGMIIRLWADLEARIGDRPPAVEHPR